MAFMDKLKFWKHEEDPLAGLGELESAFPTGGGPPFPTGIPENRHTEDFGALTPMSPHEQAPSITPAQPQFQIVQPQPLYSPVQPPLNKDMEILSLKLDAIKNTLDTINMRLERLEHMSRGEEYPMKQGRF